MGETIEICVSARLPSSERAKRVRTMLMPRKRPAFADRWPAAERTVFAAFADIDFPEVVQGPKPNKTELAASWLLRDLPELADLTRLLHAFASCGAKRLCASLSAGASSDSPGRVFFCWADETVQLIELARGEQESLNELEPLAALARIAKQGTPKRRTASTKKLAALFAPSGKRERKPAPAPAVKAAPSAWQLDSPAWVRSRKAQWKPLRSFFTISHTAREIKRLEEYFLKGTVDADFEFRQPQHGGPMPFVFRFWLHPDHSRATFDELLERADETGMWFSEDYVGRLLLWPPPSYDAIAPLFHALFYAEPGCIIPAVDARTGKRTGIVARNTPGSSTIWNMFLSWVCEQRVIRNPLCRYLMSRAEGLTEPACSESLDYYRETGRDALFIDNLRRIASAPEDPRFESVQTIFALIRAGKLPAALSAWLRERGLTL